MQKRLPLLFLTVFAVAFGFLIAVAPLFGAPKEKVLHYFGKGKDGARPEASLIFDAAGNLYGTTFWGGRSSCGYNYGCGTVFQLTPSENGNWTEKVLYSFGSHGCEPGAALMFDAAGNLYGTAVGGDCDNGTVFQLAPGQNDSWTYTVLYSFTGGSDGAQPIAALISDAVGNLYGTTAYGGVHGWGTAFELERHAKGKWTEKVLHSFNFTNKDGYSPLAGLILDAAGNLYGTTWGGGASGSGCNGRGCGAVFELTPGAHGTWKEKLLHSFNDNGKDGQTPDAALVLDSSGNLYGTTSNGGLHGYGTVFELTSDKNGGWREKVLHSFDGKGGETISGGLIFDAAGNLYGTAALGGVSGSYGTAFVLKLGAQGKWTEIVLHRFSKTHDGNFPATGLVFDSVGNLYGTTVGGGSVCGGGCGTVFKITP